MMMQIAKAPHMRKKRTTFSMMMELFVCLLILYAVSLTFYFLKGGPHFSNVQYGLYALQNLLNRILCILCLITFYKLHLEEQFFYTIYSFHLTYLCIIY